MRETSGRNASNQLTMAFLCFVSFIRNLFQHFDSVSRVCVALFHNMVCNELCARWLLACRVALLPSVNGTLIPVRFMVTFVYQLIDILHPTDPVLMHLLRHT